MSHDTVITVAMEMQLTMDIWTVYESPSDYPNRFIARKWVVDHPTNEILEADTLEEIRAKLPPGLHRIQRHETDDPKIVETWL